MRNSSFDSSGFLNTQFRGLQLISNSAKLLAVIALLLGVGSLVVAPLALANSDAFFTALGFTPLENGTGLLVGVFIGLILFFLGAASGMILFAMGEVFNVLLSIEANTRCCVGLLEKLKK